MRRPTESGLGPQRIAPRASPIGSYARPERSGLSKLAEGLAQFEPALARFSSQTLERSARENTAKGRREAVKLLEEKKSYNEAVEEGLIRQDQNPWFRLGMKQQFGEVSASRYANALAGESAKWIEDGAEDPEAFIQKEAEFRTQWVKDNVGQDNRDLVFDTVFSGAVERQVAGIGRSFALAAGNRAVEISHDMVYQESRAKLEELNGDPVESRNALQGILSWAYEEQGLNGTISGEKVVDAVVDFAVDTQNYEILDLLGDISSGPGKLGHKEYAVNAIQSAENAIAAGISRDWQRDRVMDEQRAQSLYSAHMEEFVNSEDPMSFSQERANEMALQLRELGPQGVALANEIQGLPKSFAQAGLTSDRTYFDDSWTAVMTGDMDFRGVMDAANSGRLMGQDVSTLFSAYLQRQSYTSRVQEAGVPDLLRDPVYNRSTSFLESLGSTEGAMDFTMDAARISRVDAERAVAYFTNLYTKWFNEGGWEAPSDIRIEKADEFKELARRQYFPLSPQAEGIARATGPQSNEDLRSMGMLPFTNTEAEALRDWYISGGEAQVDPYTMRKVYRHVGDRSIYEFLQTLGVMSDLVPQEQDVGTPSNKVQSQFPGLTPATDSPLFMPTGEGRMIPIRPR